MKTTTERDNRPDNTPKQALDKKDDKTLDKTLGALIGGAAGDALGYAVEFDRYNQIVKRYGAQGIQDFKISPDGTAHISDDTQMTLFTACSLIFWMTRLLNHNSCGLPEDFLLYGYQDWYKTQTGEADGRRPKVSWIFSDKRLHQRRAPGTTCMTALSESMKDPEIRRARNNSKGCGGIMRVAPIALSKDLLQRYSSLEIAALADKASAITHGHPLGFMSSALFALILVLIQKEQPTSREAFIQVINKALALFPEIPVSKDPYRTEGETEVQEATADGAIGATTNGLTGANTGRTIEDDTIGQTKVKTYADEFRAHLQYQTSLVRKAVGLALTDIPDQQSIRSLGEGWVAEETLAIALYSCVKHFGDFGATIISAVNHDGDSDSTGSVAGQIMGLIVGESGIPEKFKTRLELLDLLTQIGEDLHQGCPLSDHRQIIPGLAEDKIERWYELYMS